MFAPPPGLRAPHGGNHPETTVLGIDPGLTRCGFAVLHTRGAQQPVVASLGVITTRATTALPQRLAGRKLQILHSDHPVRTQRQGALDDILQLAHISGEIVAP